MTSGFYKQESVILLFAENFVLAPEYELYREEKDTYEYPVGGWRWFDSRTDAESFYLPEISGSLQSQIDELRLLNQSTPERITKYQATKWLRDLGLYDAVMQMLESDQDAKDRWFLSPVLMRNDPIVQSMAQMLGLTSQQLYDAFSAASEIT
jgi:hypothetical protein